MKEIDRRREYTITAVEALRKPLEYSKRMLSNTGCIYLTGSFGRLEATEGSDVDAFIACQGSADDRAIKNLQEIRIKAELIDSVEALGLPEFDGDGDYLRVFPELQLIQSIGSQSDDFENTFTARLLLLLEGRALIGETFFKDLREKIINEYWRDYTGHEANFIPAFFSNDVLRL